MVVRDSTPLEEKENGGGEGQEEGDGRERREGLPAFTL